MIKKTMILPSVLPTILPKVFLIVITIGITSSCGIKQSSPAVKTENYITEQTQNTKANIPPPTRAELVMKAFALAFPDRITKIEFKNDDWALLLRDTWYYYAGGRILPENQRENTDNYRSYQFYNYPVELPEWRELTTEETDRIKSWTTRRSVNPIRRSVFFQDDLWQAHNRTETEKNIIVINFLGRQTKIHKLIHDKVIIVETLIREAAKTDSQIQTWITNLVSPIEGYGWRNIADSQSRSYHSYGIALDLLPKNLEKKQTYWLWTSQYRDDWWNVSYNERYHPPAEVIRAFESNGFIWGGKWPMFDTMHFEYRPEILILNELLLNVSN